MYFHLLCTFKFYVVPIFSNTFMYFQLLRTFNFYVTPNFYIIPTFKIHLPTSNFYVFSTFMYLQLLQIHLCTYNFYVLSTFMYFQHLCNSSICKYIYVLPNFMYFQLLQIHLCTSYQSFLLMQFGQRWHISSFDDRVWLQLTSAVIHSLHYMYIYPAPSPQAACDTRSILSGVVCVICYNLSLLTKIWRFRRFQSL